jgi:hypothetical protein
MRRTLSAVLSAATTVAALGVSGCAGHAAMPPAAAPAPAAPTVAAPPADLGPLPVPDALAAVLYRLADAGIPGPDKLALIETTTPADTAALDAFGTALRDGGLAPITISASDIRWSDPHRGHVLATITITGADPDDAGDFTLPMEFRPSAGGWQLTRETADMLLTSGNARADPVVSALPGPPATAPGG